MNGQFSPTTQTGLEQIDEISTLRLHRNAWFENMAGDGYSIQVFDNTFVGYCAEENDRIELCETFPATSIKYVEDVALPNLDKIKVMLSAYLELSTVTTTLRKTARLPLFLLCPFAMEETLDRVARTVTKGDSGQLIFAHILSQHYSYVYAADCTLKMDSDTWINRYLPFRRKNEAINTPESRIERYQAYFAQVWCTQRQLQSFFDRLRAAGRYDEATIIVHSDHGSRISIWNPLQANAERLSDRDIIDNFSVLYAVKRPGVPPAYDRSARSIQALFAETFLNRPIRPEPTEVRLRGNPNMNGKLLQQYPVSGG